MEDYMEQLEGKLRRIESVSNLRRLGGAKRTDKRIFDRDLIAAYESTIHF